MRGALAVRINDGKTDRHVTAHVSELRFTKTAPGGHQSASMRLRLPRDAFADLGPNDRAYIYDARTGRTIWEGYTENPGVTDGRSGQEFDLSVMGGMVLASDESRALMYVDRDLGRWAQAFTASTATSASVGAFQDPQGTLGDVLKAQLNPGMPVSTNGAAMIEYRFPSGIEFGAMRLTTRSGKIDSGYQAELVWPTGYGSVGGTGISTTALSENRWVEAGGPNPPSGQNVVALRIRRTGGATNVADDTTYTVFGDLAILGRRMDRYGALLSNFTGMVANTYVRADWVVEDLLGRVLRMCDPDSATIDATSFQIDQLAYPDGARAADVLADLAMYEPDSYWGIGASNGSGKHEFWFRKWGNEPRYEISTKDGYNAPGGEVDMCNRVIVYWTDAMGRKQTTIVTQTVEALGSRIRDAEPVTLPNGVGSAANALRIGQQMLAQKNSPPKAARAVVRRKITDHQTGATVAPWEIEPGFPVRVRETGDVLRMTEMEYVDEDCAATLTLGTPTMTLDQMLARLKR